MNSSSSNDDDNYVELAAALDLKELAAIHFDWPLWAVESQIEPEGDWTTWLLVGGRGAGKTRAGAEWVRGLAAQGVTPIALVGQTMTEAIAVMVRGESGLLNIHPPSEKPVLKDRQLIWPNGVEATVLSASNPEGFRGPQFAAAWSDEIGKWRSLAGSNRIAVQTASGQWEVIGFAEAELVSPGRYRLAGLLRGLDGTSTGTGAVNAPVFLLDGRAATLTVEPHRLGEARQLRVHAGSSDLTGQAMTVETGVDPALPMRPVHLRAGRLDDGSVLMTWTRQSRAQGDGWGPADAPLEHVPERYLVRVLDGVTEKRSFEVAAPTASYSSAEQTADFGTLPTSFTFTVAQISPVLGVGHAAQGEFA